MQRYKLAGCAMVLLFALASPGRGDDAPLGPFAFTEDPRLHRLISLLNDPDPTLRSQASQKLIAIGQPARPALRRELSTTTPQTRSEIDRVLLHVPWIKHDDNETVEQAFTGYAELDAESRCERIDTTWLYPSPPAPASALLRIIMNDPCTAVRWEAAEALWRVLDENDPIGKDLIALVDNADPSPQLHPPADQPYVQPADNAPLLALAGWANRADNPARSEELMERSLSMEQDHPSAFRGQMNFVFLWLAERAFSQHQSQRVIQLVREQASRTPWSDEFVPAAISNLFAMQADYGPDPQFTSDLRAYQNYFTHPEMIYTLSRLATRKGHTFTGELLGDIALTLSGLDAEQHFLAGDFLTSHRWIDAAERELKFCLYLPGVDQTNVYLRLSRLAEQRSDDFAAARYMELGLKKNTSSSGLKKIDSYGRTVPWPVDDAWAEVYMHYLRAAQQNNDLPAIRENLDKLLGTDNGEKILATDPGLAADVVPALQVLGRTKLADEIFDKAFTSLKEEVDLQPKDPMPKNNLAWLCACANKRLEEGAKFAAMAVTLAPDDGACLDTQAEIYMRQGHPAKAAELEAKALEFKPEDLYMAKQLKRFQAAAKQSP
jgi:tetratricopeptide (TPR) repeat protein